MSKHSVRVEHLSFIRAIALCAASAISACGASVGGPVSTASTADGGAPQGRADGGSVSAAAHCPGMCAAARASACGEFNEQCVAACEAYIASLPARCASAASAFFACAASSRFACVDDGPEVQGCDAQAGALGQCAGGGGAPSPEPGATDRCLPDSVIPEDIAATLCAAVPSRPWPHDCPGGAPAPDCVAAPSGEANVFCCAR
jgi:hypothetical protein